MLLTLFAFGSIGFYVLLGVAFIVLMLCVQFEKNAVGFFAVLATLALLILGGNEILPWIQANPLTLLLYTTGYIVVGTFWSLAKWFLLVKDRKEAFLEYKIDWLKQHPDGDFKTHFNNRDVTAWDDGKWNSPGSRGGNIPIKTKYGIPEPRDHKKRIMGWMGWWPWSLVNAIMFDFFQRVFKSIYTALTGVFRGIAHRVYGDVLADMNDEK